MADEHKLIRDSVLKLTGVKIDEDKVYLFEARLSEIMKEYGLTTYDQVAAKIDAGSDQVFLDKITEKITTHETRFFRDESIFDALVMQIVPEWLEKNAINRLNLTGQKLKIWSAACSTGQEPYSLQMMISEKMPDIANITQILGTDISRETVERAQKGVYSRFEVERGLPPALLEKYFVQNGNQYSISENIKSHTTFKKHNLITEAFPGPFDVIFCRNVAIYFEAEARKKIYENLRNALRPDGVLILGSSENLAGYMNNYIVREFGLARYYEMNASQVTIFKRT